MSKTKKRESTNKEKQTLALQAIKGVKGFQKKTKGAELIKARSQQQAELAIKQTETIEGIIGDKSLLKVRDIANDGLEKATLQLVDAVENPGSQYIIIHAALALLRIVEALNPQTTLQRETHEKEFLEIPSDQIVLYETELDDYNDMKGVEDE